MIVTGPSFINLTFISPPNTPVAIFLPRSFGDTATFPNVGLYEKFAALVVPGMGGYHSLEGQIPGLDNIPKKVKKGKLEYTTSANEALYQVSLKIFGILKPQNLAIIEALHKQYADEAVATLKADVVTESTNFGYGVALAVLDRANNDNFALAA